MRERANQLEELRRQLTQTEQELCELRRDKERDAGGETEHLRSLLKEKEGFIKVCGHLLLLALIPRLCLLQHSSFCSSLCQDLIQTHEEAMQPFSKENEAEIQALKEELELALKKEMEAQVCVDVEIIHQSSYCLIISILCVFSCRRSFQLCGYPLLTNSQREKTQKAALITK